MSDYDLSIHRNPDAQTWAKFFMEVWKDKDKNTIDEADMVSWFANAMMAMHDHMRPDLAPVVLDDGSAFVVGTA
jgi:hypothetical protein